MLTSRDATTTSVSDSASSQNLLDENVDRRGFWIVNDSSSILYIKFGATATTTDWTVKLAAGDRLEHLPGEYVGVLYVGRVDGIWSANGSGAARITEFL
jgi:hypothetical protein